MRQTLRISALLGAGILTAVSGHAQKMSDPSTKPISVTGCLAMGEQPNEFKIRDATGKTFSLTGDKVALKPHVGHQVTITGASIAPAGPVGGEGKTTTPDNAGSIQVSDITMVSRTCP